jgi:hypothetical protein
MRKGTRAVASSTARLCSDSPSSDCTFSSPASFLKRRQSPDVAESLSPTSTPDSHKFSRKRVSTPTTTPESLKFRRKPGQHKRKTCPVGSSSEDEVSPPNSGRGKPRERQARPSRSTGRANSRRRRRRLLPESPPSSSSVGLGRPWQSSPVSPGELDAAIKLLTDRQERRESLSGKKKRRASRSGATSKSRVSNSPLESFDDEGSGQGAHVWRESAQKITMAGLVLERRDNVMSCASKHCNGTLFHTPYYYSR